jgi:hypothetical protein
VALVIAFILIVAAFGLVFIPIVTSDARADEPRGVGGNMDALGAERDHLLTGLKDIDMDLAMGKVSSEDHAEMRQSMEDRAVDVLAEIDGHRRPTIAPDPR